MSGCSHLKVSGTKNVLERLLQFVEPLRSIVASLTRSEAQILVFKPFVLV